MATRDPAKTRAILFGFAAATIAIGCASSVLKHKDSSTIENNREFDQAVSIVDMPTGGIAATGHGPYVLFPSPNGPYSAPQKPKAKDGRKTKSGKGSMASSPDPVAPQGRQPELEDAEGFVGRRPIVDPYRVGEKVTLELSYFGVAAGDLEMELKGFSVVNGRKAYRFGARATSRSVFSMIYAVDDWAETFVDYETFVPSTYSLHVKESKQLREQRMYFDWTKKMAYFWDKRVTKEDGVEEKKLEWATELYSQTIFSGPFYLRSFQLVPGKKLAFRVANEGKNYVFTGEVLRRETITVPAGEFKTVVVRPKIQLDGNFQPMGEILFWLTDDDRKFFVRIESKIKIGTIVGVAREIQRGTP